MGRKFERRGPLLLAASAFGVDFAIEPLERPDYVSTRGVAVVTIAGPLSHAPDPEGFDDYQSIELRVRAALASSCTGVVMRIDSPGGVGFGAIETARTLRRLAEEARKPLVAFVEGYGASAAYALACGASAILALPSALVGSIGVIEARADVVEQTKRAGVNVQMVVSGARKGDTHAHVPITDEALAAAQSQVDELAAQFFELVAEARGTTVEAVAGLEAGLFVATQPTPGVRLVDGTTTFDRLLAMVASGGLATARAPRASAEDTMDEFKKMLAALAKMAEGDGEEAAAAKKMLAAIEDKGAEPDGDEQKPAAAEGDEHAEPDGDEQKPAAAEGDSEEQKPAAKMSTGPSASASADDRIARLEAAERERERAALLRTRPDLTADPKTRAWLSRAPLATVKNAVHSLPRMTAPVPRAPAPSAASLTVQATRAEGQAPQTGGPSAEPSELDVRMGLAKPAAAIRRERTAVIFAALPASDARALVAQKGGAK